jgi:hypothetical protein
MKTMKKIIYSALVFSMIICGGCEKELNIVPKFTSSEEQALGSTDGMDAALSYAYNSLHSNIGLGFTVWSELMADHMGYQGTLANYANYYKRDLTAVVQETVSSSSTQLVNQTTLKQMYNAMNAASLVIRGVDKGLADQDATFAANKNRIQGEAYFIRAVSYFETVRFWAKAWGASPDNSHPGILINTAPVDDRVSQIKPRATLAETYAFIIGDLTKAVALLPDGYNPAINSASYNGRAYKDAAIAYLARVYFQQQDYVNAKRMIDLVIGSTAGTLTKHPLNGSVVTPFTTRGGTNTDPENIYQTTSSIDVNSVSNYWYSATTSPFNTSAALPNCPATAAFVADAKFRSTDQRRISWFKVYSTGQLMPIKYVLNPQINIPIIRSAEMVLDRAEIYALAGNIDDAVADCNVTRARAQIALLPTTISQSSLVDSIKTERIRELCFEGDRLWNLKRQRLPIPAGDRAATPALPWDGLELVLKFSTDDMAKNPALVNNY